MRTSIRLAMLVAGVLAAPNASAQRGMGMGPMHYDLATETTISGTVDAVQTMQPPGRGMGGGGGIHLVFNVSTGPIAVHVGPAAYVQSKSFTFEKGDALTVTGSKVTMNGEEVVIAREIVKGDQRLTLRDAKGFPLWAGRGGSR